RDERGGGHADRYVAARAVVGGRERGGAHAERERGQTDQGRQHAPDYEQDADEVDVRGHAGYTREGWTATRTSTRTGPVWGAVSLRRTAAPSATPAGRARRTGWLK